MEKIRVYIFEGTNGVLIPHPLTVFPDLRSAKQYVTTETNFTKELPFLPEGMPHYIQVVNDSILNTICYFIEE